MMPSSRPALSDPTKLLLQKIDLQGPPACKIPQHSKAQTYNRDTIRKATKHILATQSQPQPDRCHQPDPSQAPYDPPEPSPKRNPAIGWLALYEPPLFFQINLRVQDYRSRGDRSPQSRMSSGYVSGHRSERRGRTGGQTIMNASTRRRKKGARKVRAD
jgi:hypothetical protein